jgi:DNA-binding NarL/FixJ family response regulator
MAHHPSVAIRRYAVMSGAARRSPKGKSAAEGAARGAGFTAFGEEFMVLSFSLAPAHVPSQLTAAEQQVFRQMLEGLSNQDIASVRRTSLRTIANQVASIYRKLDVTCRPELLVKFGAPR